MSIAELMRSLADLADEETALFAKGGRTESLKPIAAAKQRLLDALEAQLAEKQRLAPDWVYQLEERERDMLSAAARDLAEAAERNRAALSRQLQLTDDLLNAVAAELQRRSGRHNRVYAQAGTIRDQPLATPLSINTKL